MTTTTTEGPRLYSGWRKRRGLGVLGLSPGESVAAIGSITVLLFAVMIFGAFALMVLGPPVVVVLIGLVPVGGLPVHFYVRREVGFA